MIHLDFSSQPPILTGVCGLPLYSMYVVGWWPQRLFSNDVSSIKALKYSQLYCYERVCENWLIQKCYASFICRVGTVHKTYSFNNFLLLMLSPDFALFPLFFLPLFQAN